MGWECNSVVECVPNTFQTKSNSVFPTKHYCYDVNFSP